MADASVVKAVQGYLAAVRRSGIHAEQGILFGSYARGDARPDSDVDVLIIAPEFDKPYDRQRIDLLWELRVSTDSRIEPVAVGERQWRDDRSSPLIEIARREGVAVAPLLAA
jgi:predicted nucleotidyltransferase